MWGIFGSILHYTQQLLVTAGGGYHLATACPPTGSLMSSLLEGWMISMIMTVTLSVQPLLTASTANWLQASSYRMSLRVTGFPDSKLVDETSSSIINKMDKST